MSGLLCALESKTTSSIIFILVAIFSTLLLGYKIFLTVRLQVKYKKSIKVLTLKARNYATLITAIVLLPMFLLMLIYTITYNPITEAVSLCIVLFDLIATLAVMSMSRCGVVDTGVFTSTKFIAWSTMYDYYINREKCTIVFSGNVKGGLTLVGTSFPLSYDKRDEEKLLYILDNNKSQFLSDVVVR